MLWRHSCLWQPITCCLSLVWRHSLHSIRHMSVMLRASLVMPFFVMGTHVTVLRCASLLWHLFMIFRWITHIIRPPIIIHFMIFIPWANVHKEQTNPSPILRSEERRVGKDDQV